VKAGSSQARTLGLVRREDRRTAVPGGAERRAWPRTRCGGRGLVAGARLLPGRDVQILDLSCSGAFIETSHRILPGARVELYFPGGRAPYRVRGLITRSHVAVLDRERGIRYRGALMFDERLMLDLEGSDGGG
jgi:hypothetical protein